MLHALALKLLFGDTLRHYLCVMDDWAVVAVEGVCCCMTVISASRRWSRKTAPYQMVPKGFVFTERRDGAGR